MKYKLDNLTVWNIIDTQKELDDRICGDTNSKILWAKVLGNLLMSVDKILVQSKIIYDQNTTKIYEHNK